MPVRIYKPNRIQNATQAEWVRELANKIPVEQVASLMDLSVNVVRKLKEGKTWRKDVA